MSKPFIRVRVKLTGHQIDIHRSHYDPEKHVRVSRVPDAMTPRPSKHKARLNRKLPPTSGVEGSALPISAGTEKEGGEP